MKLIRQFLPALVALLLGVTGARASTEYLAPLVSADGSIRLSCTSSQLPLGNGTSAGSCSSSLPSAVAVSGSQITLDTASSTTAGRVSYDATAKTVRLGDGTRSRYLGEDVVQARDYLACDGTTDDTAAFQNLVQSGGDASGKTLLISDCTVLLASPGAGSAVATLQSGTRIVGANGGVLKLGRKACSAGTFIGARCTTSGTNTSECGTLGYCTFYGGGDFAPTGGSSYTVLKGASGADGIEILGLEVDAGGVEPWNRCFGGTSNGKPCKQVCTGSSKYGCTADSDCSAIGMGSCDDENTCFAGGGWCATEPQAPSGAGKINVFDFGASQRTRIDSVRIVDHRQGDFAVDAGRAAVSDVAGYGKNPPVDSGGDGAVVRDSVLNAVSAHWPNAISGLSTALMAITFDVYTGVRLRGAGSLSGSDVSGSVYGVQLDVDDRAPTARQSGQNLVTGNRVQGTKNFASAFVLAQNSSQNVIDGNYAFSWNCLDGSLATANNTFTSNRCFSGAGPKVVVADGGWAVENNYLAWGSGAYCADSTASGYGNVCSCGLRQCVGGAEAGANCDADADCPSSTCGSATTEPVYPCYDEDDDGSTYSCDGTASKARCVQAGAIRIGREWDSTQTKTHQAIGHSRVVNNIVFNDGEAPQVVVEDQGWVCADSTATNYGKSCVCGSKQCASGADAGKNCDDTSDCNGGAACSTSTTQPCYDTDADTTGSGSSTYCHAAAGGTSKSLCKFVTINEVQIAGNTLLGQALSYNEAIRVGVPDGTNQTVRGGTIRNLTIANNVIKQFGYGVRMPSSYTGTDIADVWIKNNIFYSVTDALVGLIRGAALPEGNVLGNVEEQGSIAWMKNSTGSTLSACLAVEPTSATDGIALAASGTANALGVMAKDLTTGNVGPVTVGGVGCCTLDSANATITQGDPLKPVSSGKLDKAASGSPVVAYANESATASTGSTIRCTVSPRSQQTSPSGSGIAVTSVLSLVGNGTRYLKLGEVNTSGSTQTYSTSTVALPWGYGDITGMRCTALTAAGAGASRTFAIVYGAAETASNISCTITGGTAPGGTTCSDTDDLAIGNTGTPVAIKSTVSSGPASSDVFCVVTYAANGL